MNQHVPLKSLTRMAKKRPVRDSPPRRRMGDPRPMNLEQAPPVVQELVTALREHEVDFDMGSFTVGFVAKVPLASRIEQCREAFTGIQDQPFPKSDFDVENGVELTNEGGMTSLGVAWNKDDAWLVVVELEHPTLDRAIVPLRSKEEVARFFDNGSEAADLQEWLDAM